VNAAPARARTPWPPILAVLASGLLSALAATFLLYGDPRAMSFGLMGDFPMVEKLHEYVQRRAVVFDAWEQRGLFSALWHALVESSIFIGNTLHFWVLQFPLELAADFPVSYNLQGMVAVFLAGAAMAALAWSLVGEAWIAVTVGVLFAANPIMLQIVREGKIRESLVFAIPLFVLFFLRAIRKDARVLDILLGGMFLGVLGVFYWFYAHFALMFIAVFMVGMLLERAPERDWWRPLRNLVLMGVIAANLAFPFMTSALKWADETGGKKMILVMGTPLPPMSEILKLHDYDSWNSLPAGSLKAMFWNVMSADFPVNPNVSAGQPVFLLLLAAFGVALGWRRALPWVAALALFYVISLGPYLRVAGAFYPGEAAPWSMPYHLFFRFVPFLYALFHPDRAAIFYLLCVCVLAAFALEASSRWLREGGWVKASWLLGVYVLVQWFTVLFQNHGRYPAAMLDTELPSGYYKMVPSRGWILEAPLQPWVEGFGLAMAQMEHGRRVIYRYQRPYLQDRLPPASTLYNPLYNWLGQISEKSPPPRPNFTKDDARALRALGADWLVLHEQWFLLTERTSRGATKRYEEVAADLEEVLGPPDFVSSEKRPALQALVEARRLELIGARPADLTGRRWRVLFYHFRE